MAVAYYANTDDLTEDCGLTLEDLQYLQKEYGCIGTPIEAPDYYCGKIWCVMNALMGISS